MKDYPTTKDEFWQLLDCHWENIFDIIYKFSPNYASDADNLRLAKDPTIVRVLNAAWNAAPDSPWIHSIPSWDILCNLCSESYVLYDEEDNV